MELIAFCGMPVLRTRQRLVIVVNMAKQHSGPLPHSPPRQILVMFEGHWEHQLAMLRGILKFATEHTNWVFRITDPEAYLRGELADWPWEGMLVQADVPARRLARKLRKDPRPVISLADTRDVADWPCVFVDNEQVARLAAEYLLSKQASKYAFIGGDFSFSRAARCVRGGPGS